MKKGMSFQTQPKVIDDVKSNKSAGNIVVSNFDDNTYETSEGEFESYCETILTTNYIWDLRTVSRMVVLEFEKINKKKGLSENEDREQSFRRVLSSPGTPILTTMGYCHYVLTDDWNDDIHYFKQVTDESHDLGDRETE